MNTGTASSGRRPHAVACLLICGLTVAIYWQVTGFPFLEWDDPLYVTGNGYVRNGLSWENVAWAFTSTQVANWHPLTWLSHMLDVEVFGLWAGGHHLVNVLLHLGNGLLLYACLASATARPGPSALVALLFAIHPLHVESVAWVSERKDVLSGFGWMAAMWFYLRFVATGRYRHYVFSALAFALGLLAKPMVISLPVALLILDYWPLQRMRSDATRSARNRLARLTELVREKALLFAAALGAALVTVIAQSRAGAVKSLQEFSLAERLANALHSYFLYAWKMLLPSELAYFYPYPDSFSVWTTLGLAAILIASLAGVIYLRRSQPQVLAGLLWYLVTLVPVIGIVQAGPQAMADRYTYIPAIGLFVLGAFSIPDRVWHRRGFVALLAAAVLLLSYRAYQQVGFWAGDEPLNRHAIAVTHGNYLAHTNLAAHLVRQSRFEEAAEHARRALAIKPAAPAHVVMGNIYRQTARPEQARVEYLRAAEVDPGYAQAYYNLAVLEHEQGRFQAAVEGYRTAIALKPDHVAAMDNLASALTRFGRATEAERLYRRALAINPHSFATRYNLGSLLENLGRRDEAGAAYREVLATNPAFHRARLRLARLYLSRGEVDSARAQLRMLLEHAPDHVQARRMLEAIARRGSG